jgi:hypothetical protein
MPAGLTEETCRDLGHVRWGMASMAATAETAYHVGINLWTESTYQIRNADRIRQAMELNWGLLGPVEQTPAVTTQLSGICQPNAANNGNTGLVQVGSSVATGEIALNHLQNRMGMSLPNTSAELNARRPSGTSYFLNWETLTNYMNP